jgi:hypothetical protein
MRLALSAEQFLWGDLRLVEKLDGPIDATSTGIDGYVLAKIGDLQSRANRIAPARGLVGMDVREV